MPPAVRRSTRKSVTAAHDKTHNSPNPAPTTPRKNAASDQPSGSSKRQRIKHIDLNATSPTSIDFGSLPELPSSPIPLQPSYWLMKAEPESRFVKGVDVKFSIDDLDNMPNKISSWDGVRNYEARNILRDKMKVGDLVVREGYPDPCDPEHPYFDAKVKAKDPAKWYMVDVQLVKKLDRFVPLKELQAYKSGPLSSMSLLSRGRLSIQPVTESEFEFIQGLANRPLETT
ncbi:hypothetical protein H4R33_001585 [Dimargaris cristalligena]|nr:hypothetical protein H4R33_001585 [Dimargaris cristalligena]